MRAFVTTLSTTRRAKSRRWETKVKIGGELLTDCTILLQNLAKRADIITQTDHSCQSLLQVRSICQWKLAISKISRAFRSVRQTLALQLLHFWQKLQMPKFRQNCGQLLKSPRKKRRLWLWKMSSKSETSLLMSWRRNLRWTTRAIKSQTKSRSSSLTIKCWLGSFPSIRRPRRMWKKSPTITNKWKWSTLTCLPKMSDRKPNWVNLSPLPAIRTSKLRTCCRSVRSKSMSFTGFVWT